jgi:hypothetical protein
VPARIDHLVVAAPDLGSGCDFVERTLGVRPGPGGRHALMGTHNRLLSLGPETYLEVIAIDPDAPVPPHPRWFGLSDPATLAHGPRLVTWVASVDDLDALAAVPELGEVRPFARDNLRWRFAVPPGGALLHGGAVPPLTQWITPSPAPRLPDTGCRFVALSAAVPDPRAARTALAARGLDGLVRLVEGSPRLTAVIATPAGRRELA